MSFTLQYIVCSTANANARPTDARTSGKNGSRYSTCGRPIPSQPRVKRGPRRVLSKMTRDQSIRSFVPSFVRSFLASVTSHFVWQRSGDTIEPREPLVAHFAVFWTGECECVITTLMTRGLTSISSIHASDEVSGMIQDTVVGFSACPWFKLLCPCLCVPVRPCALFRVGRIAVVVESNRMKDAFCTTFYGSEFSRMLTQLEKPTFHTPTHVCALATYVLLFSEYRYPCTLRELQ